MLLDFGLFQMRVNGIFIIISFLSSILINYFITTILYPVCNNYLIFILVLITMITNVMSYILNVNNIHSKILNKYIKCIKI